MSVLANIINYAESSDDEEEEEKELQGEQELQSTSSSASASSSALPLKRGNSVDNDNEEAAATSTEIEDQASKKSRTDSDDSTDQSLPLLEHAQSIAELETQSALNESRRKMNTNTNGCFMNTMGVDLPALPIGQPDPLVQRRIESFHALRKSGKQFNAKLKASKEFRNPIIYESLVTFCRLNEYGTNLSDERSLFGPESYYENLWKAQKEWISLQQLRVSQQYQGQSLPQQQQQQQLSKRQQYYQLKQKVLQTSTDSSGTLSAKSTLSSNRVSVPFVRPASISPLSTAQPKSASSASKWEQSDPTAPAPGKQIGPPMTGFGKLNKRR